MSKRANAVVAEEIAEKSFYLEGVRRGEVAAKLRHRMKEKGLLFKDVAERLGVSVANVSRSMSGSQNLTIDQLYRLADAIEMNLVFDLAVPDRYEEVKFAEVGDTVLAEAGAVIHMEPYRYLRELRAKAAESSWKGLEPAVIENKAAACA